MIVQDVDSKIVWEFATCFYNACADGGRVFIQAGQRRNDHVPALAVGLQDDALAERIRKSGEVVLHTATFQHRRRIYQLLAEGPVQASQDDIDEVLKLEQETSQLYDKIDSLEWYILESEKIDTTNE